MVYLFISWKVVHLFVPENNKLFVLFSETCCDLKLIVNILYTVVFGLTSFWIAYLHSLTPVKNSSLNKLFFLSNIHDYSWNIQFKKSEHVLWFQGFSEHVPEQDQGGWKLWREWSGPFWKYPVYKLANHEVQTSPSRSTFILKIGTKSWFSYCTIIVQ